MIVSLANIFSYSAGYWLLLILRFYISPVCLTIQPKLIAKSNVKDFTESILIFGLTLKPLIHVVFILCMFLDMVQFALLHVSFQFSQYHLLKTLSLSQFIFLYTHKYVGVFLGSLFCSIDLLPYHAVLTTMALQYGLISRGTEMHVSLSPHFLTPCVGRLATVHLLVLAG